MAKLSGDWRPLKPGIAGPAQIASGLNYPVVKLISIMEPADWEGFTEEWAHSLEPAYQSVIRFTGSGDMGRDIVGFTEASDFDKPWDNYQCKRYGEPLVPSDIWVELGKIIYHSYAGEFKPPRYCYFAASHDIGLKLKKLLTKPAELKRQLIENWKKHCEHEITESEAIPLEGELRAYLEAFDFSIFRPLSVVTMIKGHASTVFYARRFGTEGLPARPKPDLPPAAIQTSESRYVEQLLEAYSEHISTTITDAKELAQWPHLEQHFNRAREVFYHAESLRNFARDSVDPGTFDGVREEIYHGVVDTYDMDYPDGLSRVRATVSHAATLTPNCNALCTRVQVQDKQGICHHLANENRLVWVKCHG